MTERTKSMKKMKEQHSQQECTKIKLEHGYIYERAKRTEREPLGTTAPMVLKQYTFLL